MIEKIQGKKHPEDKIILVNGYALSFVEMLEIVLQHMKNESLIYPVGWCYDCIGKEKPCVSHTRKPFSGDGMLLEFFTKMTTERRMPTDEELRYYRLGKHRPC